MGGDARVDVLSLTSPHHLRAVRKMRCWCILHPRYGGKATIRSEPNIMDLSGDFFYALVSCHIKALFLFGTNEFFLLPFNVRQTSIYTRGWIYKQGDPSLCC